MTYLKYKSLISLNSFGIGWSLLSLISTLAIDIFLNSYVIVLIVLNGLAFLLHLAMNVSIVLIAKKEKSENRIHLHYGRWFTDWRLFAAFGFCFSLLAIACCVLTIFFYYNIRLGAFRYTCCLCLFSGQVYSIDRCHCISYLCTGSYQKQKL